MRTITSRNRALVYFEKGTKVETRKDSSGKEYKVFVPPADFKYMNVVFADSMFITHQYTSSDWMDFADMLKRRAILKLKVFVK